VEDIHPRELPLAIMPDLTFGPPQAVTLAPGDVLALITDGFFEWSRPRLPALEPARALSARAADPAAQTPSPPREQFGLERLRDSLRRHAGKPASEIVESLAADIRAFAGAEPQQDDLTVVIIKRTGSAA
jgi:phosphoserine phosphatase